MRLHVWHIFTYKTGWWYDVWGRCWWIFHTWSIWEWFHFHAWQQENFSDQTCFRKGLHLKNFGGTLRNSTWNWAQTGQSMSLPENEANWNAMYWNLIVHIYINLDYFSNCHNLGHTTFSHRFIYPLHCSSVASCSTPIFGRQLLLNPTCWLVEHGRSIVSSDIFELNNSSKLCIYICGFWSRAKPALLV